MTNFNKKEKSFFESQAHSDTNKKQQQFPDNIYSQKATSQRNIGKNGNKHSKKPTTELRLKGSKASKLFWPKEGDKPTNSKHKQSTDKEFETVTV